MLRSYCDGCGKELEYNTGFLVSEKSTFKFNINRCDPIREIGSRSHYCKPCFMVTIQDWINSFKE